MTGSVPRVVKLRAGGGSLRVPAAAHCVQEAGPEGGENPAPSCSS